jgi:hypothetical protein
VLVSIHEVQRGSNATSYWEVRADMHATKVNAHEECAQLYLASSPSSVVPFQPAFDSALRRAVGSRRSQIVWSERGDAFQDSLVCRLRTPDNRQHCVFAGHGNKSVQTASSFIRNLLLSRIV